MYEPLEADCVGREAGAVVANKPDGGSVTTIGRVVGSTTGTVLGATTDEITGGAGRGGITCTPGR